MVSDETYHDLFSQYIRPGNHAASDYFGLIKELLDMRRAGDPEADTRIDEVYGLLSDELKSNRSEPLTPISFGTSGWRGILGKDVFVQSVQHVTSAIVRLYQTLESDDTLASHLGVSTLDEARQRGCLVGHDNRFGGSILSEAVIEVLRQNGFKVYRCGESTTGVLSAALLELDGAFSVNLTPSHNPMEYGGYKFNGADAGPASAEVTARITEFAREAVAGGRAGASGIETAAGELIDLDSFQLWQQLVRKNQSIHGLDYDGLMQQLSQSRDIDIVIDSVHGASRLHLQRLLGPAGKRMKLLRGTPDVTFGGIAPEPSSENMKTVLQQLAGSPRKLKIGAIIDPDADRIRFTDGETEISMNQFGAMAYHYLHEYKKKRGMVAKTVATSNFANAVAKQLGEEVFETKVGFKEFKPVIGTAIVYFEESDGISIIGHTPEKDAYIGLLVALDMVYCSGMNLGAYKAKMEQEYGLYCPGRDGIEVSVKGEELMSALDRLERYRVGSTISIGDESKTVKEVLTLDGRKMILEDDSWLMIRPSGTEPKVRFYVESRTEEGTGHLVEAARRMLAEIGLLDT